MNEEFELTKKYLYGGYEDNYSNHMKLKAFFKKEIGKLPFIEETFSSYKSCYRKIGEIFRSLNYLIIKDCRTILQYNNKENHSLNEGWKFKERKDYHYINALPTEEVHVICKDKKYFLKYRILHLKSLLLQSPTSQTKSLRDFPNREHNKGYEVNQK